MATNRRTWLKQVGLGIAGVGLTNLTSSYASPQTEALINGLAAINDTPILLRSNENPYGPSPMARSAIADHLHVSNRYNWNIISELIAALSKKNNVHDENILLGAGSTEILDMVARYAALEKGNFVIADPSFDYWTAPLSTSVLSKIKVPLTADKKIDLAAMQKAINQDTRLIYICNPNNPTGTICERSSLVKFVNEVPRKVIILVDEAYLDFTTQQSLSGLINDYPNLVIVKTFSKIYGLAGARIGYGIAHKTMIDKLSTFPSAPNNSISVLSRLAAMASLKDEKFIAETFSLNEAARQYTVAGLEQLNLSCIPSHTNFIYFSLANFKKDFFQQLTNNNIQGTKIYEEQGKWTRITVGTMQEMQQFIKAIQ